jgi:hypothetical protein
MSSAGSTRWLMRGITANDAQGIVPDRQVVEGIFSEQEEPLVDVRVLHAQQGQHLHTVVRAGAFEVHAGKCEGRIIRNGSSGHRRAVFGRRHRLVAFVRRRACRDEDDARQFQLHARSLRQGQVPVVRWIEGATEDAET